MLSDPKEIEAGTVRGLHFLKEVAEANHGIDQGPGYGIGRRGDEAINSNLHE